MRGLRRVPEEKVLMSQLADTRRRLSERLADRRIEANARLRELLQLYFETEGARDPVRIVVPRGSYVPSYEINGVALAQGNVPDQQARPERMDMPEGGQEAEALEAVNPSLRRQLRLFWLAFGVVIAMLGVLIIRQGPIITASARSGSSSPESCCSPPA